MACNDWGSDVTDESYTIGQENPSYVGGAFDNVLNDANATGSWYAYDGAYQNTGWTGQDFGSGNNKTIERYRLWTHFASRDTDPKDWTFEASTTGAWAGEEVVLHTITGATFAIDTWQEWEFVNNTDYRYYRVKVTANNGNATYLVVSEIEMYECQDIPSYYFSGYVYEQGSPIQRTLYLHNRSDGGLEDSTTSSGNGYYYLETTYSGAHYIVCLDDPAGEDYNDLIIGNVIPTISG
jgi:hypothetical protein